MLQLYGTANHVNFRIIECGLQAIESCADKAKRQNWVCELYDVLNGNFCFANLADRQMEKFLNYFNLVWALHETHFSVKSIKCSQMTFWCFTSRLITGLRRNRSRGFFIYDWWCFKWICALIDLFADLSC